jgi:hypothetical protein
MKSQDELDPTPLLERLLNKSREGKLKWEPTADRRAFVVSIGGKETFKIYQTEEQGPNGWGGFDTYDVERLQMLDEKGKILWHISSPRGPLSELYKLAQRIGNQLDQRLNDAISILEKL